MAAVDDTDFRSAATTECRVYADLMHRFTLRNRLFATLGNVFA